jgi:hypothetical protein
MENFDTAKLKDRTYKAEDYEPDERLVKGALKERRCTDVLWLVLFLIYLLFMWWMVAIGYSEGNPELIRAPIQADGQICGFGSLKKYPKLYVPDLKSALKVPPFYFDYSVCVTKCPKSKLAQVECANSWCDGQQVYGTYDLMGYCLPDLESAKDYIQEGETSGLLSAGNYYLAIY